MRKADPSWLNEILQDSGFTFSAEQLEQLWQFHELLQKNNVHGNLTRIDGFENIVLKHFVDSMLPAKMISLPKKLLDIGSGPGFPGIPIKIFQPEIEMILAEDRAKRISFLREVCDSLHLQKISVFPHKVNAENFHEPVEGAITRALEEVGKTLARCKNFLKAGGVVIFLKGPKVSQELAQLKKNTPLSKMYRLIEDQTYTLPILNHQRRLLVYEKNHGI